MGTTIWFTTRGRPMTSDPRGDLGTPAFGRIEIDLSDRAILPVIAQELRHLAGVIEAVHIDIGHDDETALLLAYRKIRATSKKLRG